MTGRLPVDPDEQMELFFTLSMEAIGALVKAYDDTEGKGIRTSAKAVRTAVWHARRAAEFTGRTVADILEEWIEEANEQVEEGAGIKAGREGVA